MSCPRGIPDIKWETGGVVFWTSVEKFRRKANEQREWRSLVNGCLVYSRSLERSIISAKLCLWRVSSPGDQQQCPAPPSLCEWNRLPLTPGWKRAFGTHTRFWKYFAIIESNEETDAPCLSFPKFESKVLFSESGIRSSHWSSAITNPMSMHEDTGPIPGLAQWVKDPV